MFGQGTVLALILLLSAGAVCLVIAATAGEPKIPPPGAFPPPSDRTPRYNGGVPSESLSLTGRLAYVSGVYKLEVSALPGYVVPLSFVTPDLQSWAASHLGQDVTVWGHWDKNAPTLFLVQSTNPS